MIGARPPIELDLDAVFDAAENNTALRRSTAGCRASISRSRRCGALPGKFPDRSRHQRRAPRRQLQRQDYAARNAEKVGSTATASRTRGAAGSPRGRRAASPPLQRDRRGAARFPARVTARTASRRTKPHRPADKPARHRSHRRRRLERGGVPRTTPSPLPGARRPLLAGTRRRTARLFAITKYADLRQVSTNPYLTSERKATRCVDPPEFVLEMIRNMMFNMDPPSTGGGIAGSSTRRSRRA